MHLLSLSPNALIPLHFTSRNQAPMPFHKVTHITRLLQPWTNPENSPVTMPSSGDCDWGLRFRILHLLLVTNELAGVQVLEHRFPCGRCRRRCKYRFLVILRHGDRHLRLCVHACVLSSCRKFTALLSSLVQRT